MIKDFPGISIMIWFFINASIFLYLFIESYKENIETEKWWFIKLYIEIICIFICIPFFIYRAFHTIHLKNLKGSEKYKISNYLKSRYLEKGLFTVPGVFYGLSGIFNIIWAINFVCNENKNFKGLFYQIIKIIAIIDLIAFGMIIIFTCVVIFFKLKGIYRAYIKPLNSFDTKIKVN